MSERIIYGFDEDGNRVPIGTYTPGSVGGTIFYIDNTADGIYTFFNANNEMVPDPTVGTDCTGWTYTVTGATKDKYYVYESTTGLVADKYWGYYDITTSSTGNSIGAGKTNTETVLAITDTSGFTSDSIWGHIKNIRTSKTGNCDDWYVGCPAEYDLLRSSGTTGASWFDSNLIWTSREYNSSTAYYWRYRDSTWDTSSEKNQAGLVPIRSF